VNASLPIDITQFQGNVKGFDVAYNIKTGQQGQQQTGVMFSFPSGPTFKILSIFQGWLYWVAQNSQFTDPSPCSNGIKLPTFTPSSDSLVLKTLWLSNAAPNICFPFPSYITYEGVDKNSVNTAVQALVSKLFPKYGSSDVTAVVNNFFGGQGAIICAAGDTIGAPLATPPSSGGPPSGGTQQIIFWVRMWDNLGNELIYPHVYLHQLSEIESSIPASNVITNLLQYGLTGSVGMAGTNNSYDIYLVKRRFSDLGFQYQLLPQIDSTTHQWGTVQLVQNAQGAWVWQNGCGMPSEANLSGTPPYVNELVVNSTNDQDLWNTIILFQSIFNDQYKSIVSGNVTGTIDKTSPSTISDTEMWLWASNAPQWMKLGSIAGNGYEDTDVTTSNSPPLPFDYGTNYLVAAIKEAGAYYMTHYWPPANLTQNQATDDVIRTNDASYPGGGGTPEHHGHQTGMNVDIRLPATDGTAPGGLTYHATPPGGLYDFNTTLAICAAFDSLSEVPSIYFNDPNVQQQLTKVQHMSGHDNHIHVNITHPSSGPLPNYSPP
jgi:hypothetical protein